MPSKQKEASAGNTHLRRVLGWDEQLYRTVSQDLVSAGKLLKAKGKGGSLKLYA